MSNMWRLMATEPADLCRISTQSRNILSTTRSATCFILIILITLILTVASIYEHFTNICIGSLLILMMFFIVFSVTMIKTSLIRNNSTQHAAMNDNIWTSFTDIGNTEAHLDNQFLAAPAPPSYNSAIQDSKFYYPSPPPYSAVIRFQRHTMEKMPSKGMDGVYIKGTDQIIVNVNKLLDSSTNTE